MFNEGDNFCSEGERLETKGEMALSLAFYTNAASKFKQITLLNSLSSDVMLRAQIRRESCLKKARTMYRRLLVQSAQKSSQNTEHNNLRSSRKTNQVRTERRPCNSCSKSCFWLKDGLCSDCDLRASELHRRTARRNVASRLSGARDVLAESPHHVTSPDPETISPTPERAEHTTPARVTTAPRRSSLPSNPARSATPTVSSNPPTIPPVTVGGAAEQCDVIVTSLCCDVIVL